MPSWGHAHPKHRLEVVGRADRAPARHVRGDAVDASAGGAVPGGQRPAAARVEHRQGIPDHPGPTNEPRAVNPGLTRLEYGVSRPRESSVRG